MAREFHTLSTGDIILEDVLLDNIYIDGRPVTIVFDDEQQPNCNFNIQVNIKTTTRTEDRNSEESKRFFRGCIRNMSFQ